MKYEKYVKEVPVQGRNGVFRLYSEMDGSFLGWDSMSIRYGLVDSCGMLPEETDKLHTHEYDQVVWFISADADDMLNLGAELEVDLGETGIRHRIATPTAVVVKAGTPHFSPIVTHVDRPFFVFAVSCTGEFAAQVTDAEAKPGTGDWCKFFGEFARCIRPLAFAANDPYHYGSARNQASGGISSHTDGASIGVPLTMTWSTLTQPHNLGPWGADGKHHPHAHKDYDEALIYLSMDTDNLTELHGVADCCMGEDGEDQEHYPMTKATIMTMQKDVWHLPLTFTEVNRPMVFITLGNH